MLVDTLDRDMPFFFFPLLYPVWFFFFVCKIQKFPTVHVP